MKGLYTKVLTTEECLPKHAGQKEYSGYKYIGCCCGCWWTYL